MNRLEIFVLNNPAGVFNHYVDIPSVMSFLQRVSRSNIFSIVARKGNKSIFIDPIDPRTLVKELTAFSNQA